MHRLHITPGWEHLSREAHVASFEKLGQRLVFKSEKTIFKLLHAQPEKW